MTSSKKVSLRDSNNDRQPEMATETGNTYISRNVTDSFKIPTANPGFSMMASMIKVSPSDCDSDGQPEMKKISSDVVPRGTASSRGSLEAEFSLPWPRPRSRPLMSWPCPRSRLICLGLATASRHQSQRSRFYFCIY